MYKHSAKFERSVLETVGELAIAAQTMYRNGVCHDFSVLKKPHNIKVHSATSYLIFQYLQYWYYQYFPESSSICNTGITSIFQNLPVSAILVLPVFSRIFQYLQYWYYQYFPESSSIYNTHISAMPSIF